MLGDDVRKCESCGTEYVVGKANAKTSCKDLAKQSSAPKLSVFQRKVLLLASVETDGRLPYKTPLRTRETLSRLGLVQDDCLTAAGRAAVAEIP